MKEIARIEAGVRNYTPSSDMCEERELDITSTMKAHGNTVMRRCVSRLVRMGATKITRRVNPLFNKSTPLKNGFYIFTGYAEDKK